MKWTYEVDSERECYKILTEEKIIEHDGKKEPQWIADVFELEDAEEIVNTHNRLIGITLNNALLELIERGESVYGGDFDSIGKRKGLECFVVSGNRPRATKG